MSRKEYFDLGVTTSITVRGKRLSLRRDWLHGLWAWVVYLGDEKLGWVLQQWDGVPIPRKWACVPVPTTPEDEYDDIWYEYDTREQALKGLVPDD